MKSRPTYHGYGIFIVVLQMPVTTSFSVIRAAQNHLAKKNSDLHVLDDATCTDIHHPCVAAISEIYIVQTSMRLSQTTYSSRSGRRSDSNSGLVRPREFPI